MAKDIEFHFKETGATKTAAGAEKVDRSLDGVSSASKKANSEFSSMIKTFLTVGGAVAGAKALFDSTDLFNKSLGNLETLGPAVTDEIKNIENGFLDVAGPIGSIKELTDEAYGAISGGVEPTKVVKFMADTAAFAKGNMIDLGKAVDVTTTIQNTYGKAAGTTAQIQDQLTIAIREGKVRGEELAASFGGIAGTANTVGISFKDLNAFFISSTAGGIKFSESVSAMKAVISNIASPTEKAKKAAEGMAGGFSLASLKSQGLSKFLQNMTEHVDGNVQKQKDLFGSVEAFNAIAVVTSEKGAKKFDDALISLSNSAGAAKEAFDKQELTLEGLKNTIEATFVKAFLPVLRDLLKFVNDNKAFIISFFNGIVDVVKVVGKAATIAIKSIVSLADAVAKYSPGIKLIIQGWQNLLIAFSNQLAEVEDKQMSQIQGHASQLKAISQKYRSFAKEIGLTRKEMRQMSKDARNVETGLIDHNKIMLNIIKGKYGEKLSNDYKKWNKQNVAAMKITQATKSAVSKLVPVQTELENGIKKTVKQAKAYKDILPPTGRELKNLAVNFLPELNIQLDRQLDKMKDTTEQTAKQKTETELLEPEIKKLEAALKAIYGGLNEINTILGVLDFGKVGESISSFFKGGADIAAGIAKFKTDPLGGLSGIISGVKQLADALGGTNWAARGKTFNAAIGGLIPPELMGDFIALGEELGDFNEAWRQMIDDAIAASDIASGGDMWKWIQELSFQVKTISGTGGDINQIGDAFKELARKGSENLGYLGRDFQMLIAAIQGTGEEMQALNDFLEGEATAGLEGYIAMMDAGFTNVIIPQYEDAKAWQKKLADNSQLIAGIDGLILQTQKFGNINKEVYQDDLSRFMAQTSDAYNALIGQGFTAGESIEMLVPQLQTLNQMAADYNLTLDAGTMALISQAEEAGYNMEVQESSQSIMKKGFEDLTGAINNLTAALTGDMTEAIQGIGKTALNTSDLIGARWTNMGNQMANSINNVGESFEDLIDFVGTSSFNVPTVTGGNIDVPGFAAGTPPGGFIVPPGHPNDSFLMAASSGERVTVEAHPAMRREGDGGGNIAMNFYPTINAAPGGESEESLMVKFWRGVKYDKIGIQGKLKGVLNGK